MNNIENNIDVSLDDLAVTIRDHFFGDFDNEPQGVAAHAALDDLVSHCKQVEQSLAAYRSALSGTQSVRDDYKASAKQAEHRLETFLRDMDIPVVKGGMTYAELAEKLEQAERERDLATERLKRVMDLTYTTRLLESAEARAEQAERERDEAKKAYHEQRGLRERADMDAVESLARVAQLEARIAAMPYETEEELSRRVAELEAALGKIVAVGGAGGSPPERLPRLVKIQGIARAALAGEGEA